MQKQTHRIKLSLDLVLYNSKVLGQSSVLYLSPSPVIPLSGHVGKVKAMHDIYPLTVLSSGDFLILSGVI